MRQISGTIISNSRLLKYEGAEYFLLRVLAPEIAKNAEPGQFLMVKCGTDVVLRRPISIHSANSDSGDIELLFAISLPVESAQTLSPMHQPEKRMVASKGTKWLASRKKGDSIEVLGPLGNGFQITDNSHNVLLIAGGIGIAPLRFLAEECTKRGKNITILFGARDVNGVYPARRLSKGIKYIVATENGSRGYKDTVTQLIPQYIASADQVFACGPKAMYEKIDQQLKQYKWSQDIQVSLEERMGCGFGVCYGCSIKTRQGMKRICRDGPVFNINDIIWQEVKL